MNFGKLLAAGRSIMNGRVNLAYRENKHVYLPKFEPAKPAATKVVGQSGAAVSAAPASTPVKLSVTAPFAGKSAAARTTSWSARLNPLSRLRGEPASSGYRNAVQTELCLELVKPIHSDLRDAEVEVVPLKCRSPRPSGAAEPAAAWSELGTGVLAGKTV